jgi:hypothetical protein
MKVFSCLRRTRLALLLMGGSIVLGLIGCTAYQPPELPAGQLATISIDPNSHSLRFMAVDGVYLSAIGGLNSFAGRQDLQLRPGKRTVQVEYTEAVGLKLAKGGALLVFDAKAGTRYVVRERIDGRKFVVWLTQENGDKVPLLNPAPHSP